MFHYGRRLTTAELVTLRQSGIEALSPEARQIAEGRAAEVARIMAVVTGNPTPQAPEPVTIDPVDHPVGEAPVTGSSPIPAPARPPVEAVCRVCGAQVDKPQSGPTPKYCSSTCRQKAYRQRRRGPSVGRPAGCGQAGSPEARSPAPLPAPEVSGGIA
jgi:hypothetical protein